MTPEEPKQRRVTTLDAKLLFNSDPKKSWIALLPFMKPAFATSIPSRRSIARSADNVDLHHQSYGPTLGGENYGHLFLGCHGNLVLSYLKRRHTIKGQYYVTLINQFVNASKKEEEES